eukprot:Opistho-2@30929
MSARTRATVASAAVILLIVASSLSACTASPTGTLARPAHGAHLGEIEMLVDGFRPPSVPLIVTDPYQSVWLNADCLTDDWARHWSGPVMAMLGMARIDGVTYRFMGPSSATTVLVPAMQQTSVKVFPLRTVFTFTAGGVQLAVTFMTPAIASDPATLSLPVTFVTYDISSVDGEKHSVQLYYDNTAEVAVASVEEEVDWAEAEVADHVALRVGTNAQNVLGQKGDFIKINWGHSYIAVRANSSGNPVHALAGSVASRFSFVANTIPPTFDTRRPRRCDDDWISLSLRWDFGAVLPGSPVSAYHLIAYDQVASIDYFGEQLTPYWKQMYGSIENLIWDVSNRYSELHAAVEAYESTVLSSLFAAGGAKYATLGALAFRQTTGAMVVVWSAKRNQMLAFMKEISSDGDVSTVDVVYPASPFLIHLAPELLKLTLMPLMYYANNETSVPYNLAWAPHHLGQWPICDIRPEEQEQMPVEETANMLAMFAAIVIVDKNSTGFLDGYWDILQTWGDYLVDNLPDPGNQLCTDDFEGPSPHNVNLAAKGVIGLAAYSILLETAGKASRDNKYFTAAVEYAQQWIKLADDGDHTRLQYDEANTWSLKYNLLFH